LREADQAAHKANATLDLLRNDEHPRAALHSLGNSAGVAASDHQVQSMSPRPTAVLSNVQRFEDKPGDTVFQVDGPAAPCVGGFSSARNSEPIAISETARQRAAMLLGEADQCAERMTTCRAKSEVLEGPDDC